MVPNDSGTHARMFKCKNIAMAVQLVVKACLHVTAPCDCTAILNGTKNDDNDDTCKRSLNSGNNPAVCT